MDGASSAAKPKKSKEPTTEDQSVFLARSQVEEKIWEEKGLDPANAEDRKVLQDEFMWNMYLLMYLIRKAYGEKPGKEVIHKYIATIVNNMVVTKDMQAGHNPRHPAYNAERKQTDVALNDFASLEITNEADEAARRGLISTMMEQFYNRFSSQVYTQCMSLDGGVWSIIRKSTSTNESSQGTVTQIFTDLKIGKRWKSIPKKKKEVIMRILCTCNLVCRINAGKEAPKESFIFDLIKRFAKFEGASEEEQRSWHEQSNNMMKTIFRDGGKGMDQIWEQMGKSEALQKAFQDKEQQEEYRRQAHSLLDEVFDTVGTKIRGAKK